MSYVSAEIPEKLSIKGIYTVFHRELTPAYHTGRVDVHNFPEIIYMRRGEHKLVIDGEIHNLRAGEMIIYAPMSAHSSADVPDCSVSIISFDVESEALEKLYNRAIALSDGEAKMLESVIDDGCRCFVPRAPMTELHGFVAKEDADEYLMQGMKRRLELFLLGLLSNSREVGGRVEKKASEYASVIRYLYSNIYKSLTVSEIADGCRMSVSKLKYLFRENYSGGVIDCFIEMKIEEAKRLISESGMNLTEISDRLAFSSIHYFSRTFKKRVGVSPSGYLKKL
jgi:AraC-like DNA-binding protein